MNLLRVLATVWVLVLCIALGGTVLAQQQPASSPAGKDEPQLAAADLRDQGISYIKAGRFEQGMRDLVKASALAPKDAATAEALSAVKKYADVRQSSEQQRKEELQQDVQRVERCRQAQAYLPALAKAGIEEKLRKAISAVSEQYYATATSEALGDAGSKQAAAMKQKALAAAAAAKKSLQDAMALVKSTKSPYVDTLRQLAAELSRQLDVFEAAWKAVDTTSLANINQGAEKLLSSEDDLIDALADVESMVSKEPWRMALLQARMVQTVALPSDKIQEQDWYKAVVRDAEARGAAAVKEAQWLDALYVYSSLAELDPNSAEYKDKVKLTRGHVRVLRLYGPPAGAAAATQPADDGSDVNWKDLTQGIDAEMVRIAIGKVNDRYVTALDYRKLVRGALRSVKVLAETPQAAHSFPVLKDAKKRDAFVAAINKQLDNIDKKDRVDYTDLQYKLNSVLRASDNTLGIPAGVLTMEYTDGFLEEMDKFSTMVWPKEVEDFNKSIMGTFCGVGIQIAKDPKEPLKVVAPLPGSPAIKKGIKSGDLILRVDGVKTDPLSLEKLMSMIMGKPGTKVMLTVKRRDEAEPVDLTLIREQISIRTVKGWRQLKDGDWDYMLDPKTKIGYLRLTQFTGDTVHDSIEAIQALRKQGCKSLVLDLRFNPGGLLTSAASLANEFVKEGVIVSTKGRQQTGAQLAADANGCIFDGNVVVLINDQSASAAEIVSGALKDLNRAIIIGDRSYGKGSVQNVLEIEQHNAYLKLTTAHYYLPSGRCLHREDGSKVWGVDPDVKITLTPKQMKRWLDVRRKTDLLKEIPDAQMQRDLSSQLQADTQLQAAVMVLRLMQLQGKA